MGFKMEQNNQISIYPATPDDISVLVCHNRLMFIEIWDYRGWEYESSNLDIMDQDYREKLERELPDKDCKAWVIKKGEKVLASVSISILSMVPIPNDPQCKVAYMHSVYTEEEWRGKGLSKKLVEQAIEECKASGIKRMTLNASYAGKSLYEKLGFEPVENAMRLWM